MVAKPAHAPIAKCGGYAHAPMGDRGELPELIRIASKQIAQVAKDFVTSRSHQPMSRGKARSSEVHKRGNSLDVFNENSIDLGGTTMSSEG